MNKVHIYICAESFALSRFENVGVWERLEVTVPEEQYAARDVGGIAAPYYEKEGVVFVGVSFPE